MTTTQTISDADLDAVLAGPNRLSALAALLQHGGDAVPDALRESIKGEMICAELLAAMAEERATAVTQSRYPHGPVRRRKALDAIFGDGAHAAFVSDLYDGLRAKAKR